MEKKYKRLAREQLSETLNRLVPMRAIPRPRRGWIRAIRDGLGMTGVQFAKRLGVAPSRVTELEKGEISGAVSLTSMRRAAEALGCVFIYAVVPRTSLEDMIRKQATAIVQDRFQRVAHSMALEEQAVPNEKVRNEVSEAVEDLVRRMPKTLWDK